MNSKDRSDLKVVAILDEMTPTLNPQLRARALEAMRLEATQPSQPKTTPRFSRRRLVATILGVCVILIALGFVPLPIGKSGGLMDKAMAALMQATAVHLKFLDKNGNTVSEFWVSEDCFKRSEYYTDGELTQLNMESGLERIVYEASSNTAKYYDLPPVLKSPGSLHNVTSDLLEFLKNSKNCSNFRASKQISHTIWGGTSNVINMTGTITDDTHIGSVNYDIGDNMRAVATINSSDPNSAKFEFYRLSPAGEELDFQECIIEWNTTIPDAAMSFSPPQNTQIIKFSKWASRADKLIATAETSDWKVFLHSLEVERNGNILVTVSRERKLNSTIPVTYLKSVFIEVSASDNTGESYLSTTQSFNREYLLVRMKRQHPDVAVSPSSIHLTVCPYPDGASASQSVIFQNILMVGREPINDPFE